MSGLSPDRTEYWVATNRAGRPPYTDTSAVASLRVPSLRCVRNLSLCGCFSQSVAPLGRLFTYCLRAIGPVTSACAPHRSGQLPISGSLEVQHPGGIKLLVTRPAVRQRVWYTSGLPLRLGRSRHTSSSVATPPVGVSAIDLPRSFPDDRLNALQCLDVDV